MAGKPAHVAVVRPDFTLDLLAAYRICLRATSDVSKLLKRAGNGRAIVVVNTTDAGNRIYPNAMEGGSKTVVK